MGEWHHPPHYTEAAKAYAVQARRAEIAVFVDVVLPQLRGVARSVGYALTVHGSLSRDLDLVAIPWVDGAKEPDVLLKALAQRCRELTGWGHLEHPDQWTPKPHGRLAATIIASADVNLDLSVMPRAKGAEPEPD